jgi:CheY-like chemotaxis protein
MQTSSGRDGSRRCAVFDPSDRSRRTLVVDDNSDAADMMAIYLSESGYEVRTAYDGEGAVDVARTFRPDLIFMDISLPGMDGREACRRIRCEPWAAGVVIVALTGWNPGEGPNASGASGFDRQLMKPVDLDIVLRLARDTTPPGAC